jgi:hypothetical protein
MMTYQHPCRPTSRILAGEENTVYEESTVHTAVMDCPKGTLGKNTRILQFKTRSPSLRISSGKSWYRWL